MSELDTAQDAWFETRDGYGHGPRLTEDKRDALRGLREAFEEWAGEHGLIWFDVDTRLAERIADVLGVEIDWTDRAANSQSVPEK